MLLWINGPFGGGKTHTAYELCRRLPGSVVSDPEHFGTGLQRMLPRDKRRDFQDFPSWRQGVHEVLSHLLDQHTAGGPVIVPMTVVVPQYFEETVGRLRADGYDVRHFSLLAHRETVLRRLQGRGLRGLRSEQWAATRVDRCLEALSKPEFGEHLTTDHLTVSGAAEAVARSAGLRLRPDDSGPLARRLHRAQVTVKNIRPL
ncbi:AAA family ATPase [Streptomyces sp. NPDC048172]|uniref:AAA family ATPase n=1 Tax=Streptomyces sp. NPDC048172 TaxID=3365505 RepID=UPI003713A39B